jgi:methylmalonyl-CoA mutase C-terminal domain/subunit
MDGHDRGARVIARALRDAGMEVIYTGRHVSVDFIARAAVEEDVDVVGLSILSGAHTALTQLLLDALDALGARNDVEIVVGGTISTEGTKKELFAMGVADVFPGGTPLQDVVNRVAEAAAQRRKNRTT